jgi:hypothetical protein
MRRRAPEPWAAALMVALLVGALSGVVAVASAQRPFDPHELDRSEAQRAGGHTGDEGSEAREIREREDWFLDRRAFPGRTTPPGALLRAKQQARATPALNLAGAAAADGEPAAPFGPFAAPRLTSSWRSLGPTVLGGDSFESQSQWTGAPPWSGRVTAIANDPGDAAVAYVGSAGGGAWKTTNAGATWTPISDSLGSLAIGAIAIDPRRPNTIYLGTGEANTSGDSYYGSGIYKSTNGGASWTKLNGTAFDRCHTADVVVQPGAGSTVLAAVTSGPGAYRTGCPTGVYRSTDGGANWIEVMGGACRPTDLAVSPAAPSVFYVGATDCAEAGIYRSTASGAAGTFTRLTGLTGVRTGVNELQLGRISLAVAPSDGRWVWALVADASNGGLLGVFWSNDGGESWASLPAVADDFCGPPGEGGQCGYDLTVAIDPQNPTKVYTGGIWLYGYGPRDFDPVRLAAGTEGIHSDQHVATVDSRGRLWVGNDGGVYRSSDGGASFSNLNARLSITQFNAGIDGTLSFLVAGTQDNGFVHYSAGAWSAFAAFGDGGFSVLNPVNDDIIYGTYAKGTVRRSLDGGIDRFPRVLRPGDESEFYAPLVMEPDDPDHVYLGTNRVWRGSNAGRSWAPISDRFDSRITAIGLTARANRVLYVATRGRTITRMVVTTDGFASAEDTLTNGLPFRVFSDIAVDSRAADTAYVAVSGFGTGHVFKTTDFGANWTDISGNLPDSPANAIVVDESGTPDTLYVGTDVGVYSSGDGGDSWQRAEGMPIVVVSDLLIDRQSDALIAATHGRGVFATQIPRGQ